MRKGLSVLGSSALENSAEVRVNENWCWNGAFLFRTTCQDGWFVGFFIFNLTTSLVHKLIEMGLYTIDWVKRVQEWETTGRQAWKSGKNKFDIIDFYIPAASSDTFQIVWYCFPDSLHLFFAILAGLWQRVSKAVKLIKLHWIWWSLKVFFLLTYKSQGTEGNQRVFLQVVFLLQDWK